MNYLELVKASQSSGGGEKVMWKSVEAISDFMDDLKDAHPDMFWVFMRKQAGIMNGGHYNETWANYDVSKIEWTDKEGKKHTGAYWTAEQVEEATKGMAFPAGVTKYDKWVGFNAFRADTCKVLDDEHVLKTAYEFFFKDEDFEKDSKTGTSATKTWRYMCCKYTM